ncbi:hypothetical protein B9Z55_013742 [Caenorhabditis nigoni]|uniref:Ground-like domain-containing protein n=1 Tax=Caenorhabditis nigoni TaxID=1611254 RepID=A0A2G5U335_9PELO|nr:hypothetical protein B9Z55_013742 [Caenorhabditis nigoni]
MKSISIVSSIFLVSSSVFCQQQQPLPIAQAPSYYGEFQGANFGYPPIPNLLPQFQAMNMIGATTEPRRAVPKQADGTDCPMPPECGCLCGRSGGRKKREAVEFWKNSDKPESEIRCTSGKLRRVVELAIYNVDQAGIQFDLGVNTLQNYVLFCQAEKFKNLQFSTDSTKYCHISRGAINCLVIQH